jgi:ATP-binding cassette subfamily F protein uup
MLVDSTATALVVTHDRWFLDRVASSILAFEGDGKVVLYPGNYETYRRLRKEAREQQQRPASVANSPARAKASPNEPKKAKRLNRAEEQELKTLPDAIEKAEAELRAQNLVLSDPATHTNGNERIADAASALARAEAEVARLMLRWEELEQKQADSSSSERP